MAWPAGNEDDPLVGAADGQRDRYRRSHDPDADDASQDTR
jgi:hypothetical protein